ncbi:MAG TPA: flagellar protein FlbE, partial [Micavibrio sp.]
AKNEAYQQGKKDGFSESQASFEKQVLDVLSMIRNSFNLLFDEEERRGRTFEKESVQLAFTIFSRAFPALNEKYGMEEVRDVLQKVLETVREQPEIIIEVPAAYVTPIQNHIDALLRQDGGPRCIVRGSSALPAGQCRMAWLNGTAVRNGAQLAEQIRGQIEQVLADKAILADNELGDIPHLATQNGDGSHE